MNDMPKRLVISQGDKFGNLEIVREVESYVTPCGTVRRRFLCRCICGNEVVRELSYLRHYPHLSCGCETIPIGVRCRKYSKEQTGSFLYSTWHGMIQRCYDKNSKSYKNYGGRGIVICDEWRNNYNEFYKWAIKNGAEPHLTIDRINVLGNYEPRNCRFISLEKQALNKTTTRYITYKEQTKTLSEWSKELGINESVIRRRLDKYGYSVEEALGFKRHNICYQKRFHCRKKVLQFTLNMVLLKEWDSVEQVCKTLGVSQQGIRQCCYGNYQKSHGYIWRFKQ